MASVELKKDTDTTAVKFMDSPFETFQCVIGVLDMYIHMIVKLWLNHQHLEILEPWVGQFNRSGRYQCLAFELEEVV